MTVIPDELLAGLNEAQQKAVSFKDGPLLVLAGPGSGKTRVVTHRIAALMCQGVGPSQIVALTFTNKAAEEMKLRLQTLAPNRNVWIGTFHKFCAYLLHRYVEQVGLKPNFTIYDTDETLTLLKNISEKNIFPPGVTPQKVASAISWAKNDLVMPDDYLAQNGSLTGKVVEEVYPLYQNELKRANAVDFDDLLLHTANLLKNNPKIRTILDNRFRYVLVDEYQDTNSVQYMIAKALSQDHPNLAVTGDPDQSIYGWRGANIENILHFEKDYPNTTVIRLEQNYRSCPQILAVADAVIDHNLYRKQKKLFTQKTEGKPVRVLCCDDQQKEAEIIAAEIAAEIRAGKRQPSDYAICYRMNALSRNLEHAFRREKVPFQLVRGLEFFNRKEIKDILAYLRVVHNPSDTVSFHRIINLPARGIGKTTLKKLSDRARQLGVSVFNVAEEIESIPGIATKTKRAITNFVTMIRHLAQKAAEDYPVTALIGMVLKESGYRDQYQDSENEEDQSRLENIEELLSEAEEFDRQPLGPEENALEKFLEQAALVADSDALDEEANRISLLTLHAAKGLEFPVVYIIGLEENILPHDRANDDLKQLEEERRLFFVGITRAMEELRISWAQQREFRGSFNYSISSRFLFELPKDENVEYPNGSVSITQTPQRDPSDSVQLIREELTDRDENQENPYDDAVDPIYEDEDIHPEYDEDGQPIVVRKKTKKPDRKKPLTRALSLTTAAKLQQEMDEPEPEPGMLVRHSQFGMGTVQDFWGQKTDRKILIEFFTAAGWKELPYPCEELVLLNKK